MANPFWENLKQNVERSEGAMRLYKVAIVKDMVEKLMAELHSLTAVPFENVEGLKGANAAIGAKTKELDEAVQLFVKAVQQGLELIER